MAERFEQLKLKYHAVLNALQQRHATIRELRLDEHRRLLIRAEAPTAEAKDHVWSEIRRIDADHHDLVGDISIIGPAPVPSEESGPAVEEYIDDANRAARPAGAPEIYTVQPGDTLFKLAADFYGDRKQYVLIFNANRDQLEYPDDIRPGQQLVIPENIPAQERKP